MVLGLYYLQNVWKGNNFNTITVRTVRTDKISTHIKLPLNEDN